MARRERPAFQRGVAIVTIFAITGTLSGCGRYGSPVRVSPATQTVEKAEEAEEQQKTISERESAEAPSDRSIESR